VIEQPVGPGLGWSRCRSAGRDIPAILVIRPPSALLLLRLVGSGGTIPEYPGGERVRQSFGATKQLGLGISEDGSRVLEIADQHVQSHSSNKWASIVSGQHNTAGWHTQGCAW
jgi:hypothetical protein